MNKAKLLAAAACVAASLVAGNSYAYYDGFASANVNLRAGPGRDFPVIAKLTPNHPVRVNGCLSGRDWCEIEYGNLNGWVSTQFLQDDRRVFWAKSQPVTVVPTVVFEKDAYWDDYYRHRPFYKDYRRKHPAPAHYQHAQDDYHSIERQDYRDQRNHDHDHDRARNDSRNDYRANERDYDNRPRGNGRVER